MTGRIAAISASVIVSSYEPWTIPFLSTANIQGSESRPHWSVIGRRLELPVGIEDRLERPSTTLSWYGSTLMNVTSGFAAATGLNRSSVGPHCALVQNFGVAKMRMNGLWAASASATEVW